MSKIATLKHLPTPADVRENVQQLSEMMLKTSARLDETAAQVKSLEQLPELITDQVTEALQALAPLLQMREEVQRALESFDQVAQAQRTSLEALGRELATKASASMESRAAALDGTIKALASQAQGLKSSMASMQSSSQALQQLPASLSKSATQAAEDMKLIADELTLQAQKVCPVTLLQTLGQMLGAALITALAVVAGQAVLSKPAPPSAEMQQQAKQADQLGQLARKSTPKELELINQILLRPDK